jgi:hypothetical protein
MEWGMKVQLVDKRMLFPAFGKADPSTQTAYVRNDLPKSVQSFVVAHELYHLSDKTKWWLWREIKATLCIDWRHWKGFLLCAFMSMRVARLKFYATRLRVGK